MNKINLKKIARGAIGAICLLGLTCTLSLGQITVTNTGEIIYSTGGSVYINGNYISNPTSPSATSDPQIWLNSPLFITGNIVNNGVQNIIDENNSSSFLQLNGSGNSDLEGASSLILNELRVNKTGNVIVKRNISVLSNLQLVSGNVDLQNYEIDLGQFGALNGEDDTKRVFTLGSGTIRHTLSMGPSIGDNPGGLGLQTQGIPFAGRVISRGHLPQPNAGDGSIQRYYDIDIDPGDEITQIRFNYFTPELNGITEADLSLYISYNNGSSWEKIGGTVDLASNFVAISGLSITNDFRITLSDKDCTTPPTVDLGSPSINICTGNTINLDAGNPGSAYLWSTGESTQVITVSTAGTYSVTVTNAQGCTGFDTIDLISRPSPVVAFNNSISCQGQVMNFTNNSTIASGSMTYSWDFGDPSTTSDNSTATNPSYTYSLASDYAVSLTATSNFNCVTNLTKNVTSYPIPVVDFSLTPACLGIPTDFTNESTISVGGMTYFWDFGDGNTSTQTNPNNLFGAISSYNVLLTATSNANCINSVSKTVDVHHTPVSSFTASDVCELINVPITNNSTITAGTLSYSWDFGDATTDGNAIPIKSYGSAGPYTISLTAISDFNCVDAASASIDIRQNPIASFSVADDCQDKAFLFTNTSTSGEGSLTYNWNFNDGNTSVDINPIKNYLNPSTYNVSLTATTSFGCVNTAINNLEVYAVPETDFTATNVCQDLAADFTNNTTIANGTVSYSWSFDDGGNSSLTNPSHNYGVDGTYNVQLASTSDQGCVSSLIKPVEIYPLPIVDLGGVINTCGVSYLLDAGNPGSTYLWSDGSVNQQFTATQNGTYNVTVTTVNGCSTFESVDITLKGEVVPNLGIDRTVCGGITLDAGYPGSSYNWSNGETTKTISVNSTGAYNVTITDQNGCSGSDEVFITVNPIPVVDLGSDIEVCADQPVVLDAGDDGVSYLWSNGTTQRTLVITQSGHYEVSVTNSFGCVTNDDINVIINPMPINPLLPSLVVCDVVILDASNPGSEYLWSDNSTDPTLVVDKSGTYGVEITTDKDCYLFTSSSVTVNASPIVDLGPDIELCFGESVILNGGAQGATYLWSNGLNTPTITASSTGLYSVDVIGSNGCITNDQVGVTIFPEIQNELNQSYELCANSPLLLNGFSGQGVSYEWRDAAGIISNQSSILLNAPGNLWLVTRDIKGCIQIDSVDVQIDPDPITSRFLVASIIDVGDSVQFVEFSYPDPVSFDWDFADGLKSSLADPMHIYLRPGDFDVALKVGDPKNCYDTKSKVITVRLLRDEEHADVILPFIELVEAKLHPNPSSLTLNVDVALNNEANITINLYSLNGFLIESKTVSILEETIEFDIRDFPSGTYFIRIFVNEEARTLRFIKI
ncbi:MAG: PKD domain-containing protein [Cyclobacteriaceae bacterium]